MDAGCDYAVEVKDNTSVKIVESGLAAAFLQVEHKNQFVSKRNDNNVQLLRSHHHDIIKHYLLIKGSKLTNSPVLYDMMCVVFESHEQTIEQIETVLTTL